MLVRELFCYRPGDGLDVIGHLSEASDDRYVNFSTVAVGAKLLEAGAEAVAVSCDAGSAVKIVRSAVVVFSRQNPVVR